MKDVLGVTPRDLKDTIIDMAYSLIDAGLVKKSKKFKVKPTSLYAKTAKWYYKS